MLNNFQRDKNPFEMTQIEKNTKSTHAMNIKLKFNINKLRNYDVHLMSMTSTRRQNNVKNVHPNILIRLWNF